jgi:hypothetical protein
VHESESRRSRECTHELEVISDFYYLSCTAPRVTAVNELFEKKIGLSLKRVFLLSAIDGAKGLAAVSGHSQYTLKHVHSFILLRQTATHSNVALINDCLLGCF